MCDNWGVAHSIEPSASAVADYKSVQQRLLIVIRDSRIKVQHDCPHAFHTLRTISQSVGDIDQLTVCVECVKRIGRAAST